MGDLSLPRHVIIPLLPPEHCSISLASFLWLSHNSLSVGSVLCWELPLMTNEHYLLPEPLFNPREGVLSPSVKVNVLVTQSCQTLRSPMDWEVCQASLCMEFSSKNTGVVALCFSQGFSRPRDQTQVSCIAGRFLTTEPHGKPQMRVLWETKGSWRIYQNKVLNIESPGRDFFFLMRVSTLICSFKMIPSSYSQITEPSRQLGCDPVNISLICKHLSHHASHPACPLTLPHILESALTPPLPINQPFENYLQFYSFSGCSFIPSLCGMPPSSPPPSLPPSFLWICPLLLPGCQKS